MEIKVRVYKGRNLPKEIVITGLTEDDLANNLVAMVKSYLKENTVTFAISYSTPAKSGTTLRLIDVQINKDKRQIVFTLRGLPPYLIPFEDFPKIFFLNFFLKFAAN